MGYGKDESMQASTKVLVINVTYHSCLDRSTPHEHDLQMYERHQYKRKFVTAIKLYRVILFPWIAPVTHLPWAQGYNRTLTTTFVESKNKTMIVKLMLLPFLGEYTMQVCLKHLRTGGMSHRMII